MLTVGVIGAGSMGRHHVRVYHAHPRCRLLGVADPDPTRAELAAQYECEYFADYRALLDQRPELVTIAAPTSQHHALGMAALAAGCHVLMEKPLAAELPQARELIAAAQAAGRVLAIGHIERFNPVVGVLREQIQDGALGDVLGMHNVRVSPYHGRIGDTGIILDLAAHDVDMISWLLTERAVWASATALRRVHNHEDHATLHLGLPSGRGGMIEQSWLAPYRLRRVRVTGTKRIARADLIEQWVELLEPSADGKCLVGERIHVPSGEPLTREIDDVVEAVTTGRAPLCTAEDGLYALAVSLAALKSTATGQAELVEQG